MAALRFAECWITSPVAGGGAVYYYFFRWASPVRGGEFGATHCLDVPFWFDNVDSIPLTGASAERYPLARQMSDALMEFARAGDPNHGGLPHWPRYTLDQRPTMVIDRTCHLENDPSAAERKALAAIPLLKLVKPT